MGLLARLGAEEGGIIGSLAVDERNEAEIGKLLFPPVGNGDFRGALEGDIPFIGPEGVDRQPLHQAASFHSPDGRTPVVLGKGIRQPRAEGIGRVAPEVFAVVGPVHVLLIIEGFDRNIRLAIGKPHQGMGKGRATYLESSESRKDFHLAYSTLWKILAMSRGVPSS